MCWNPYEEVSLSTSEVAQQDVVYSTLFMCCHISPQTYCAHGRRASSHFPELPAKPVTGFLRLEGGRPVWLHTFPSARGIN